MNAETVDSPATNSSTQPLGDFDSWFSEVLEELRPDLVVGIARGAVRLLQLQGAARLLSGIPLISQHALPFQYNSEIESKRILLFDDSVIFGSTMSMLVDYLTRRGALPFAVAYAVDRFHFLGEQPPGSRQSVRPSPHSQMPIKSKHCLWPSLIRQHHSALVRRVLGTPLDYNLDFPTLRLHVPDFSSSDIPYATSLLESVGEFRIVQDVSSMWSVTKDIHRYTALFRQTCWNVVPANGISYRPQSKLRIVFAPRSQEIRLTPIVQLSIAHSLRYEDIAFPDDLISHLWSSLHFPTDPEDPFYYNALSRLLTSFVSLLAGRFFGDKVIQAWTNDFRVADISLLHEDLQVVVGQANCLALERCWSSICGLDAVPGFEEAARSHANEDSDVPELRQRIAAIWRFRPTLKPKKGELTHESIGKLLLALREATDSDQCREENPGETRLEVGLTYEAIRRLLDEECAIELSSDDISLAIDVCIDNGLAVPKVIRNDGLWLRAFYCGEDEDDQATLQFQAAVDQAYREFIGEKPLRPLSSFDMHKLCALLKDVLPWLPISTRFYTFGRFASVGSEEVIAWLTHEDFGPLRLSTDGKRHVLLPKDGYKPVVNPTWPSDNARDFFDAFQYAAKAFLYARLSNEAKLKLLLTTCRTHRHTFNAVAFEAHSLDRL